MSNRAEVTFSPLKKLGIDIRRIFEAGLRAADPAGCVKSVISIKKNILIIAGRKYDLRKYAGIYLISAGKAAVPMAQAVESVLGKYYTGGIAVTKHGYTGKLSGKTVLLEAAHPLPDRAGVLAAKRVTEFAGKRGVNDLVIGLVSGGASALLPSPPDGITLADKQKVTSLLLSSGAEIREINTVRKHLSTLKGGRLAGLVAPADFPVLILSDVVGNDVSAIASGMTAPDPTTYRDAVAVMEKYGIARKAPSPVMAHLQRGVFTGHMESPKSARHPAFRKTTNTIVGSNSLSLDAARREALKLGYNTMILSASVTGETRDAAKFHSAILKEISVSGNPLKAPACILSGGETTVTIRGKGKGGRNMEFVLASVEPVAGNTAVAVLSAGTDGTDGPTDSAGAVCNNRSYATALAKGLNPRDYLENNDSYNFFRKTGGLVVTGPTNTNVMDIRIGLVFSGE